MFLQLPLKFSFVKAVAMKSRKQEIVNYFLSYFYEAVSEQCLFFYKDVEPRTGKAQSYTAIKLYAV